MGISSAAEAKLEASIRPEITVMRARTSYPRRHRAAFGVVGGGEQAEGPRGLPAGEQAEALQALPPGAQAQAPRELPAGQGDLPADADGAMEGEELPARPRLRHSPAATRVVRAPASAASGSAASGAAASGSAASGSAASVQAVRSVAASRTVRSVRSVASSRTVRSASHVHRATRVIRPARPVAPARPAGRTGRTGHAGPTGPAGRLGSPAGLERTGPIRAGRPVPAPVRLTRRGRLVLGVLAGLAVAALALLIWIAVTGQAQAASKVTPATGRHDMLRVVVRPGQTLWTIAEKADPAADPRLVIQEIITDNTLSGTSISAGQVLWVPRS